MFLSHNIGARIILLNINNNNKNNNNNNNNDNNNNNNNNNNKAELLITQANQAIKLMKAEEVPNLNNINLLQYVTAYVISEKLGKTPKIPKTKCNKRQQ